VGERAIGLLQGTRALVAALAAAPVNSPGVAPHRPVQSHAPELRGCAPDSQPHLTRQYNHHGLSLSMRRIDVSMYSFRSVLIQVLDHQVYLINVRILQLFQLTYQRSIRARALTHSQPFLNAALKAAYYVFSSTVFPTSSSIILRPSRLNHKLRPAPSKAPVTPKPADCSTATSCALRPSKPPSIPPTHLIPS
jgi:hypothetical protein